MITKQQNLNRHGLMMVLSSPSGAGKTSLSRKLLKIDKEIFLSVSYTTRPLRPGEENEKDYFFIDNNLFGKMRKDGEFLEDAKVFGFYYATPKKPVQRALESGFDVLFDIDWQGTQQLMDSMQEDLVKVFVLPPSVEELEKRLHNRKQDNDIAIQERMSRAADEISHYAEYDYIIVNDNFEDSLKIIHSIIIAERYKRQRQINALNIIKSLRNSL